MQSSLHHGHNEGGGSPWGSMASHICNGLNQKSKDGGGLTWFVTQKIIHLKAGESMG